MKIFWLSGVLIYEYIKWEILNNNDRYYSGRFSIEKSRIFKLTCTKNLKIANWNDTDKPFFIWTRSIYVSSGVSHSD